MELLESWWEDYLEVELIALNDANQTLRTTAQSACADPTETNLDGARDAWRAAHSRLKRQEVFAFGPYTEEPERFRAELDFWPARPDTIEAIVADESLELDAELVGGFGGAAKGLPAAEYLLFGEEPLDERRCHYLVGIAGAATQASGDLHAAWDPDQDGYYRQLLQPGSDSDFETIVLSVSAVINRLWFTVENIRKERLGKPLGTTSGGSAQPELAESRFSGEGLQAIRDNLAGVEALYFGGDDAVGVARFVDDRDPQINRDVEQAFVDIRASLDAIDGTLGEAVVDDPAAVETAIDELGELQRLIEVDVISSLGLSRSFNDADGD